MDKNFLVKTDLFCGNCLMQTEHVAVYDNNEIVSIKCSICDNKVEIEPHSINRAKNPPHKKIFSIFG